MKYFKCSRFSKGWPIRKVIGVGRGDIFLFKFSTKQLFSAKSLPRSFFLLWGKRLEGQSFISGLLGVHEFCFAHFNLQEFFCISSPTLITFLMVRPKVTKGILFRNHVTVCNLGKNLKS